MRRSLIIATGLVLSAGTAGAQGERWVTETEATAGRGTSTFQTTTEQLRGRARMEVTRGTQPSGLRGFSLFDTTDFVTVDPVAKTFTRVLIPIPVPNRNGPPAPVTTKMERLETTIDSSAVRDEDTKQDAMRYLLTITSVSVTTFDASHLPPGRPVPPDMRVALTQTYEFWYPRAADGAIIPPNRPSGMASELAVKTGEAFGKLPRRRAIRTISTTRTEGAAGVSEQKSSMRLVKKDSVTLDEKRFMIPAGFTEKPMFGPATADAAWLAKWMSPPR